LLDFTTDIPQLIFLKKKILYIELASAKKLLNSVKKPTFNYLIAKMGRIYKNPKICISHQILARKNGLILPFLFGKGKNVVTT